MDTFRMRGRMNYLEAPAKLAVTYPCVSSLPAGRCPMSRFFAEQPNPLDIVVGTCQEYTCADIEAVDFHLRDLQRRIKAAPKMPELIKKYRADFDLLLDRRLWLEMTKTPEVTA